MQKLGQCLWRAICQCLLEVQIHLAFDLVITLLETWFTYTHTYKKKVSIRLLIPVFLILEIAAKFGKKTGIHQ